MSRRIPKTKQIKAFLECRLCAHEKPFGIAPRDWRRLEIGWTRHGLQVWCVRHEMNIIHIDFEGMRHPAEDRRLPRKGE